MKYFVFLLISVVVQLSVAPPVNQKSKNGEHKNENDVMDMYYLDDEYRRYLTEVVQVLESDPEFRAKLEKADEADIRTGKIAEELQFVNHNIRSRLDELKREELVRLRHLATKENELKNGLDIDHLKIAEHLDHTNTRTFEIQDLKKLIAKTTEILSNADNARREQFKYHEMEKEYEEQGKLKRNDMSEEERKKYEQELKAMKEQQKKHEPVHHPGSKQQLEEVWEKQDHMEPEEFNPRTFFFFHDVDGNGVWDQDEAKALFLKELDKLYVQGTSHVDLLKRAEEMERMREHVFNEIDLNKDGLISYEEFLEQTKKPDFQQDEGWQGLDEQEIYTRDEFERFQRQKELAAQAMPLPQYGHIPDSGAADMKASNQQNLPQQQFQDHSQHHQQQGNVVPQHQYPNHVPIQPIHDQIPQQQQQQHFQEQIPMNQQYQQMQGHVPVQQMQGQVPVQQMQGQVPVQQMQGQVPVQHMQGQVPAQQMQASLQQEHIPVQQHQPQAPNFQQQNVMNQVPQNVQNNAIPQHNNPSQSNTQSAQAQVQQEINRNVIPSAGKM